MPDTIAPVFDIEQFNQSTKALWDTAFEQGYRQGDEKKTSELARHYARQFLELAEMYLEVALRGAETTFDGDILRVVTILSRTPMVVPNVREALSLLRSNASGVIRPDGHQAAKALSVIRAGVEALA